jgi:hypothetical protein
MRRRGRGTPGAIALCLCALCAVAALATSAWARSQLELSWPLKDVFPVAVRFVRVDRGCKVTDRDESSGYIVFECGDEGGKQVRRGALELIAIDSPGRGGVRAQLTLSDEPRYIELRFLELLERKLRDERGVAPPQRQPPPPPPPPDAGL